MILYYTDLKNKSRLKKQSKINKMCLRENRSEAESLFNINLSEISLFRSCAETTVGMSVCNVIAN